MKADLKGVKDVLQNKVCQSLNPGHGWGRGKGERCMGQLAYVWPYPPPEKKGFFLGVWVGLHVGQGTG